MRSCRLPPRLAAASLAASALLLLLCGTSPHGLAWPGASRARQPPPGPPKAARGPGSPPSFAYWISGTGGEGRRVLRLLKAVYHPRNRYLLHLDAGASAEERAALAAAVRAEAAWREFGNVDVVGESYAVDSLGSSVLAAALHGAAVLLRIGGEWDCGTGSSRSAPGTTRSSRRTISFMPFLLYQGKSTLLITQVILDGKSMKDLKNLLWTQVYIWMETLSFFLQQKQDKCLMHSRYSQVLLG